MKLFILCFLVTINAFAKVGDFTPDSENTLYIVDGDSISMQMRLAGIDTLEMRQKCTKIQKDKV
jgi:endonuclease YncB( thermonuclease family)